MNNISIRILKDSDLNFEELLKEILLLLVLIIKLEEIWWLRSK
jgi:hypothetical protein